MINKNVELNKAYGSFHKRIGKWLDSRGVLQERRVIRISREDFSEAGFNGEVLYQMFIREGWMNTKGQLRQNLKLIENGLKREFDDDVAYKIMSVLRKSIHD